MNEIARLHQPVFTTDATAATKLLRPQSVVNFSRAANQKPHASKSARHGASRGSAPSGWNSIGFFTNLLSGTLSRQGLLYSTLCARLQVKGVTLHFFNDVFGLHLALKPPQGILDRLAFLQSNFCQLITP